MSGPFSIPDGSVGSAPSNKWAPFFGEVEGHHEPVRADDKLAHETYNLPKAYEGKNRRLEDILDFMIRKEDEFYTRDLLPWKYVEDLHVSWNVFKFNRTLADVIPEQGIPRLVTQETERHTDNLIRRGIAFQLEHGFMTTEEGRRNYSLNLQQITDAVHTTAYFGVLHALFAGQNYYSEYRRKYARHVKAPRNLFRHERQMWALLQKDIKGVYTLDAEIKHHMKVNGVTPNVLVLPPKAGIYVSMVPPSETTYSERGPGAHEALTKNRTGIETFRGLKVFEAQAFDVDFVHDHIDLTSRSRMIGEYFVIPAVPPHPEIERRIKERLDILAANKTAQPPQELQEIIADLPKVDEPYIHIYSADQDDFVKIKYSDANLHAFNMELSSQQRLDRLTKLLDVFHEGAKLYADKGKQLVTDEKTQAEKKRVAALFQLDPNQGKGEDFRWAQASSAVTLPEIKTAVGNLNKNSALAFGGMLKRLELNVHEAIMRQTSAARDLHQYDILIFRPFQSYNAHTAIMAAGGEELGFTAHGHHDFQLADNVQTKTHLGHYTFYSKSIVRQPKRYSLIPDCFVSGYISGENAEFFTPESLKGCIDAGSLGSPECHKSLIAWKIPKGQGAKLNPAIDLLGRFALEHRDYESGQEHYQGARILSQMAGINELDQNRDDSTYLHQVQHINTTVFRGAQYTNGVFSHRNQGHWGDMVYAGVLPVKDGVMAHADTSRAPKKGDRIE